MLSFREVEDQHPNMYVPQESFIMYYWTWGIVFSRHVNYVLLTEMMTGQRIVLLSVQSHEDKEQRILRSYYMQMATLLYLRPLFLLMTETH